MPETPDRSFDGRDVAEELKQELAREYENYVRIAARLTHRSRDSVREALHDVIARLLAALTQRPADFDAITAWKPYLIQSVVNELKEKRRQVARRKRTVIFFGELDAQGRAKFMNLVDPGVDPAEQAEQNELAALAWSELQTLPEYQRDVIVRRCRGESYREIAMALAVKSSTAEAYWSRGIAEVRSRLRDAA